MKKEDIIESILKRKMWEDEEFSVPVEKNLKNEDFECLTRNIFKCDKCANQKRDLKRVPVAGNIDADTMIILQNPGEPGYKEKMVIPDKDSPMKTTLKLYNMALKVYWGNTSKIRGMLQHARKDWDDCYITNAIKCRKGNRKTCLKYLKGEFTIVDPEIIVCFGNTAKESLRNLIEDDDFQIVKNPDDTDLADGIREIFGKTLKISYTPREEAWVMFAPHMAVRNPQESYQCKLETTYQKLESKRLS